MQTPTRPPIRVGVSTCLLGERVRYNGDHKRDDFLVETLGRYVEFVPVCPEVELGLGIPREPIRLVRHGEEIRLISQSGRDISEAMRSYAQRRALQLAAQDLCGYVLKKNSPSCGYERVKVHGPRGRPAQKGRGFFAQALRERFPLLPIEEEGRLSDPIFRESFLTRVFAFRALKDLFSRKDFSTGALVRFHTAYKLLLMAHSPQGYRRLGRLVAEAKGFSPETLSERYQTEFMKILEKPATVGRHVNVLQHIAGYFKKQLSEDARLKLAGVIEEYRRGLVSLAVPRSLLRHHVQILGQTYLANQVYLAPYPEEIMLKDRV